MVEKFDTLVINETEVKLPSFYKVILHNDDFTPMDFVIQILQDIFHKSSSQAQEITLAVHNKGASTCGTFTREIAETKAGTVIQLARQHEYPLQCTFEPE